MAHRHEWDRVVEASLGGTDSIVVSTCECGAVTITTAADLNPGIDEDDLPDELLYDAPMRSRRSSSSSSEG